MGDRVVDCARLESVCAERHRGFESPPIRHLAQVSRPEDSTVALIGQRFWLSELFSE